MFLEGYGNAPMVRYFRGMENETGEVKDSAEREHPKSAVYAARPLAA